MKTTSRFFKTSSIVAAALLAIIPALPSFALTTSTANATASGTCAHITTLQTTSLAAVTTSINTMNTTFKAQPLTITSTANAARQKVAAARQNALTVFKNDIAGLLARKGLTASQRQAIHTYQVNVETADQTREHTIDQALDAYHTALLVALQTHQTDLSNAVASFQDSVTADFASAEASCNNGTSAVSGLKTNIAGAQTTLKTAVSASQAATGIDHLISTRNNLIQAANGTFTSTITTDTKTLQAAL